jgi:thiol-disulfide isomerase/thioredoxin
MKQRTVTLLILMFAVLVLGLHLGMKKQPDMDQVREMAKEFKRPRNWTGKTAPDFTLKMNGGEDFVLSEHVGKEIIILNFFATWCGPCKKEMPELVRFYNDNKDKKVVLVGINADEKPNVVSAFADEQGLTFPVGIDTGVIRKKYGVLSYPTTVLIGVDGKVQLYEIGSIMNADITFGTLVKDNLAALDAGKAVKPEQYKAQLKKEDLTGIALYDDDHEPELKGRAREISLNMYCPCGCDDLVAECSCKTSDDIKAELSKMKFDDGKSNDDIIRELNAKYCNKEKK